MQASLPDVMAHKNRSALSLTSPHSHKSFMWWDSVDWHEACQYEKPFFSGKSAERRLRRILLFCGIKAAFMYLAA